MARYDTDAELKQGITTGSPVTAQKQLDFVDSFAKKKDIEDIEFPETIPGPAGPAGPPGESSTVPGPAGPIGPAGPPGDIEDLTAANTSVVDNDDNFPETEPNVEAVLAFIANLIAGGNKPIGPAGGMLRGNYPNPTLELVNSIDPGTYPFASITVDEFGRIVGIIANPGGGGDGSGTGDQRANTVPTDSPLTGPTVQAELEAIREDIGGSNVPVRTALASQSGMSVNVPGLSDDPSWYTVSINGIESFDGYSIPSGGGQVDFATALSGDNVIINHVN